MYIYIYARHGNQWWPSLQVIDSGLPTFIYTCACAFLRAGSHPLCAVSCSAHILRHHDFHDGKCQLRLSGGLEHEGKEPQGNIQPRERALAVRLMSAENCIAGPSVRVNFRVYKHPMVRPDLASRKPGDMQKPREPRHRKKLESLLTTDSGHCRDTY